jgi:hypothetical protein
VWFVYETYVVWKTVNTLPVDRLCAVVSDNIGSITKNRELLVVFSTDHLVTCGTEPYRRNASVCLCGDSAVTESTVETETFHRLTIGCNTVERLQ